MFTGIVQEVGKIKSISRNAHRFELEVECSFSSLQLGESISIDGVCLTVTRIAPQSFFCDLSPETTQLTIAANYRPQLSINLERSLSMGDRMGGHWVSGHVDGTAQLVQKEVLDDFWKLRFQFEHKDWTRYLFPKGSIALNGVSLTVNRVENDSFEVMLIPHTVENTNFQELQLGHRVNFEIDWMSKLIVRTVNQYLEAHNET